MSVLADIQYLQVGSPQIEGVQAPSKFTTSASLICIGKSVGLFRRQAKAVLAGFGFSRAANDSTGNTVQGK